MNYTQALEYIDYCSKLPFNLNLNHISELTKRLDSPHTKFRSIHITGTNGKGSTTAMMVSVLRGCGLKVAAYTSPHLCSYRERITINGVWISKKEFAYYVQIVKNKADEMVIENVGQCTEFEIGTAVAFLYFAENNVDIAVIEVGMGGRTDATNIITPIMSIITHIALDHQQYLGDTVLKIANEKSGIIKPNTFAVIGVQDAEVYTFLTRICDQRGTKPLFASDINVCDVSITENGTQFKVNSPNFPSLTNYTLKLNLLGSYQIMNALNIIAALPALIASGFSIIPERIQYALEKTHWAGRMERIVSITPLHLYFDGAHNPDGALALVQSLKEIYPNQKVDLVVGILKNRPIQEMAKILSQVAKRVIVTTVPDDRTSSISELEQVFKEQSVQVISEERPENALQLVQQTDNKVAVITGSLYLVGLLRSKLLNIVDNDVP